VGRQSLDVGIHLVSHIPEAQRRGATLIVIDPRTTPLAKQADIHLAVRPGTDLPVALSIHGFCSRRDTRTSVPADARPRRRASARAAREWTFERAAAEADVSVERYAESRSCTRTTRPAVIDAATAGAKPQRRQRVARASWRCPRWRQIRRRGGGYMMSNSASWGITNTWTGAADPPTRIVNMNLLGRALTEGDPAIRLLFVYNSNPAVTTPDQRRVLRGLERDDLFTVVV
jgi:anaerobic selenocysteine-containing dehydrogenase